MNYVEDITELIGRTPLLRLKKDGLRNLFVKLEMANIGGSVKDRIALKMICTAETSGKLKKGYTIVEPTSGNTGIAVAMIGAAKGYKVILTMPKSMSVERRQILSAFGAKLVLTEASGGMRGAIEMADKIAKDNKNHFRLRQFDNPANPLAHEQTTAKELIEQLDGKVDIVVCGVGTGGTITGLSKEFKTHKLDTKFIAVEPIDSPVLSGGSAAPHKIQGIGAGFIPSVLNTKCINKIEKVSYEAATQCCQNLAKSSGLFLGISSGAAISVAIKYAKNCKGNVVVIAPDGGEKYLSTQLY